MKLFIELEPRLRRELSSKGAKRMSFKKVKTMKNKAIRRALNRDLSLGKETVKRNRDYEF